MQPSARAEVISRCNLCFNCLGKHLVAECRSNRTCMKCSGKHHTSIHDVASAPPPEPVGPGKSTLVSQRSNDCFSCVLLATARVNVRDRAGERHSVCALIDPGSEVPLVSENLVRRLHLRRQPATVPILGIGASSSGVTRGRVLLDVQSQMDAAVEFEVNALILPRLTAYSVDCRCKPTTWRPLQGLTLADPHFDKRAQIDLLLGADVYTIILEDGVRKGDPHTPVAQKTSLGWILSGVISPDGTSTAATSLQCSVDDHLQDLVQRFWAQEEPSRSSSVWSKEEQQCEDHFKQTHFRLQDGRSVVRLPLKSDLPSLVETRRSVTRLLQAMEGRFTRDVDFATKYRLFMSEYQQRDHMVPVRADGEPSRVCYLPHHGVLRSSTQSSKIRVVFNGSQRIRTGESLNDFLMTGPKLLPDLSSVILRWRRHKFVFAADIEKMYRQVRVHTADRPLQRTLWREHPDNSVEEFELKTVTYGLACAPFLAIRTLHQLPADESEKFPLAAEVLRTNVYVDGILSGASTIEDALDLERQLMGLCTAGGFPPRKWVANDSRLLAHLPGESTAIDIRMSWDEGLIHPTLGIQWHLKDDCFSFSCERKDPPASLTKRSVLSNIAQMCDPLGWLAPVIIYAKVFFQSLWLQRLDWDTPLHSRDQQVWRTYAADLPHLEKLQIPRFSGDDSGFSELHDFADASERAYAAVVYLRCVDRSGCMTTSLLLAKTRVASIKQISLPRLELSAAVLLTRLAAHMVSTMSIAKLPIHLWTDSMVVLGLD